jgi:hypothetical protein
MRRHQSAIFENGGKVGVGNTSPAATLDLKGNSNVRGTLNLLQTTSSSVGLISIPGPTPIADLPAAAEKTSPPH